MAEPGSGPVATAPDRRWLERAIELSRRCPPSHTAFAVGAVLVARDGSVLATGYSRESDPHDHAEEAALAKLRAKTQAAAWRGGPLKAGAGADARMAAGPGMGAEPGAGADGAGRAGARGGAAADLSAATLYSSLEPCRYRASRPRPCAELIIEAGLRRVVIAWLEPPVFAAGGGAWLLREAGVTVVEIPELAAAARAVNAAVLGD
jgi:diaminohydroxyphosphoribosylaminopyrimidine deaminase / 5-amino-6-(5-phosphoribosylamino)uracil reductase